MVQGKNKQFTGQVFRVGESRAPLLVFSALLLAYHLTFGQFFPTSHGTLGHDWSWIIPSYLQSYADYLRHGIPFFSNGELFKIFTSPAACHGGVYFAFAIPHDIASFLVFSGLSPVNVAYIQFLLYASIGFWGMYFLLKQVFDVGLPLAVLGAGIFMFNGFYAHRIVIGHLFFSVMLLPLLVYCLTYVPACQKERARDTLLFGVLAGVVAYFAFLLRVSVVIVAFLLPMLGLLAMWLYRGGGFKVLLSRSLIACVVALGLAFQWLYALSISHADQLAVAQRISYSFPVFRDVWTMLRLASEMLFLSPADMEGRYVTGVLNLTVAQQRHELEYGVTWVPLMLLLAYGGKRLFDWLRSDTWLADGLGARQWTMFGIVALVFVLPVIYTTNFPALLPWIKQTPLINATTSPQRTFFVFVVLLPVLSILALSQLELRKWTWPIVLCGLCGVVAATHWKDRDFYHDQPYDPGPIEAAHLELRNGGELPPIDRIGILGNGAGGVAHDQMIEANLLLKGVQHMGCYIPAYSSTPVEYVGSLHPGSIWDETDGHLNIKNPACNSWPRENGCRPGDHFKIDQKSWVEQYIRYEPYPMVVPDKVRGAAWVSAISFFVVFGYLFFVAIARLIARRRELVKKRS